MLCLSFSVLCPGFSSYWGLLLLHNLGYLRPLCCGGGSLVWSVMVAIPGCSPWATAGQLSSMSPQLSLVDPGARIWVPWVLLGERVSHPSRGTGSPEKMRLAALNSENAKVGVGRARLTTHARPRGRNKETKISCILFLIVILHLPTAAAPAPPSDDHFGRPPGSREQSWGLAPPPGRQPRRTSHNYKLPQQLAPVLGRWAKEEARLLIVSRSIWQ